MIPTRAAARSAAACALLLCACADRPPPVPEFRESRAWSHLVRQLSFGPRHAGNAGHRRQLAWMVEELEFRADTVIRQPFTATDSAGGTLRMTSLVARFRPELADRVLLVANWDTRLRADGSPDPLDRRRPVPGANLNASGVAVLLELAQLFREQPPPVGVDLLLADGDDYSREVQMRGTEHFIQSMPGYRPRYAVVLQAVADVDAKFPMDSASAGEPAGRMWEAARRLRYDSVFVATPARPAANQAQLLAAAGIPTVVVADREYGPLNRRWHATDDLPRYLSRATLGVVGRTLAATLYAETPGGVR